MSKSHYFVQTPPKDLPSIENGARECRYCGMPFYPKHGNSRYCSKECHHKANNINKYKWWYKHKDEHNKGRRERGYQEGKFVPKEEYLKLVEAKKKRNRVIKQELINLELMTFQIKSVYKKDKVSFYNTRRRSNPAKVELIINELHKLGLYRDEILQDDKYHIDYSQEYTKRLI